MPMIKKLRRFLDKDLVMVYTMGKVGSTAIETAIESNLTPALHIHTLYGFPPSPPYHRFKYGRLRMALHRLIVYPAKRFVLQRRKNLRIITFYRDPNARNPSMFMQALPFWLTEYFLRGDEVKVANRAEVPDMLLEAYKSVFLHEYPAQWIERELSTFTGIATEELALGTADYKVVERGKFAVFIGRAEAMDACAAPLAEFLGRNSLEISEKNRGSCKWYAPVYADFRAQLAERNDIDYCEAFRRANGYQ